MPAPTSADRAGVGARPADEGTAEPWLVRHRWELALALIALVAGVALRWWILGSVLGGPDFDEATVGIQARRFGDGQLNAFFLNQGYGGTLETALVAGVFQVSGSTTVTLKLVPMVLALAAAAIARQLAVELELSRTARWCAPALVWCGPAYAVLFSTKERGFYGVALVLAAAVPTLAVRLAKRPLRRDALLLGLCLGLGIWTTPLTLAVALPALVWLVAVRPQVVGELWVGVPLAILGALPWLWWNVANDWGSLHGVATFGTTWWDRFFDWLLRQNVVMGVETPFAADRQLVDWRWAGLAALVAVLVVATRRTNWEAPWFFVTMVVGYGAIYAANGLAAGVGADPRYTYLMVPVVAVAIAACLPDLSSDAARFALSVVVVGLAVGSTAWGLAGTADEARTAHPDPFLASPGIDEVVEVLEAEGVEAVISDTAGMQVAFLTDEEIVGASFAVPRLDAYEVLARATDPSTYVLDETLLDNADVLRLHLEANEIGYRELDLGTWRVFLVDERVLPGEAGLFVFGGKL